MSTFEDAGQDVGIQIWRIEDFEAVPWDASKYGKFHVGDSYLVLSTTKSGSKLVYHLHFWLGEETSQDEYGTAAIKAVELDDSLGGLPVQHREVQDHESALFSSYFKTGIKYLPGGVKSGFTHVDPESVEKRLFLVKGKRDIKVKQVDLDISSLNKSDCFILDQGKDHEILVFMPANSNRMERFKATQAANEIRDEDYAGNASVEIVEADDSDKFFEALGGGTLADVSDDVTDDNFKPDKGQVKLMRVSDDDFTEVATDKLIQDMLDPSDCFILNCGSANGIFVWIGKESSKDEKIQAMKHADNFLATQNLPKWTSIERVVQGAETAMFKQYFSSWQDPEDSVFMGLGRSYPEEMIAEFDVADLHAENRRRLIAKSAGSAIGFMPDNAQGDKEIFRVEDFELVALEEEKYGMFFAGDSYVLKYSYVNQDGRQGYIVYFWQGQKSSQDEKAASAIYAVKMDDELSGKAVQVRVVQGKEPRHFIKMFGGKMIVFNGGKASGFKNVHDHDTFDESGSRLFQVRGTCSDDVRAVQVEPLASSLNSEDVFILETADKTWIWKGQESTDQELEIGQKVIEIVSPGCSNQDVIDEGSETDDFWQALGGQSDYCKTGGIDLNKPILKPRLFHCLEMSSGNLRPIEVFQFKREDLNEKDVMICDSGDEIYLWIGSQAKKDEKEKGLDIAKEYLSADPTDRNESNTLIFTIKQGEEPKSFTCVFPNWA